MNINARELAQRMYADYVTKIAHYGISNNSNEAIIAFGVVADTITSIMDQQVVLKVKRTKDAKKFPLIATKKYGDTGYDLYAVMPYWPHWSNPVDRQAHFRIALEKYCEANCIDCHNREQYLAAKEQVLDFLERETFRERIAIRPGDRCEIPTGIFLELPDGYWATINGRSSTSREMLIAPDGVIDEGYRGELFAVLMNVGTETQTIKHGDRKVQLIIHKRHNSDITIEEVDELSESERGEDGFGSTGK